MANEKTGVSAEVGVKKRGPDGKVVETRGFVDDGVSKRAWAIFFTLVALSPFGVWKVVELLGFL